MKTVFIHAGLPKTGSTSIQNFLHEEREALELAGFLFPSPESDVRSARRAGGEGWGRHASLLSVLHGRMAELPPGEWDLWAAELDRFRHHPDLHTLILSHETIGNHAGSLDFAVLAPLLDGAAVRVLLVVREPEAWLTSLFEQRVVGRPRESGTANRLNTFKSYREHGYQGRIVALQRRLPAATITIVPFEDLVTGDGLVPNSADILGLPAAIRARAVTARRANTSLAQDTIELLRRCNAAGVSLPDFLALRRAVSISQRRSDVARGKRQRVFGRRRAREIAERYARDRDWVRATFGVELAPDADPATPSLVVSDEQVGALIDDAARLLTPEQATRLRSAILAAPAETPRRRKRG